MMACLLVITSGVVRTTKAVVCAGLIVWNPCLACEIERSAEECAGLATVTRGKHDFTQAIERFGLVSQVAHFPEQRKSLPKIVSGLPMKALSQAGLSQAG